MGSICARFDEKLAPIQVASIHVAREMASFTNPLSKLNMADRNITKMMTTSTTVILLTGLWCTGKAALYAVKTVDETRNSHCMTADSNNIAITHG